MPLQVQEEKNSFKIWLIETLHSINEEDFEKEKPQTEWLMDHNGNIDYHFLGKFEKLSQDIEKLSILLKTPIKLPVINKSYPPIHYSRAYDDEAIALIENYYRSDIELFGYTFEYDK